MLATERKSLTSLASHIRCRSETRASTLRHLQTGASRTIPLLRIICNLKADVEIFVVQFRWGSKRSLRDIRQMSIHDLDQESDSLGRSAFKHRTQMVENIVTYSWSVLHELEAKA